MPNEPEETTQLQSGETERRTYIQASVENDDGTLTKVLEYEQVAAPQLTLSDQKDTVTLTIPLRVQTFVPVVLNQNLSLDLSREKVREMAEMLGLFDS